MAKTAKFVDCVAEYSAIMSDILARRFQPIYLLTGDEEKADIVITSFDTTLTYKKLDDACRLVRGGAEYLSTHPDFNCPTETGFIPDSGAIAAFVTASTGKVPTYFGKPYKETIEMICEATGFDRSARPFRRNPTR